ncbi:putative 2-amino-3-carboxymuconate-6-semialdehyde decarboxylase [Jimgerdemannia flammicorona]|nr:putative 2-amino-3-carboxymuconate-6-semialdehyde decarboxylase [Jimgerdemannia flammicorona]
MSNSKVVDVHTHVYLPRYMDLLRSRAEVPRVILDDLGQDRLVILPGEDKESSTKRGRPIGDEYWSMKRKLEFMDLHGIDVSVISLANPWLDFLPTTQETFEFATALNQDLSTVCTSSDAGGRLFAFGVLPTLSPSASVAEVHRIAQLPHLRGVIMGTIGAGRGLDDPELIPLFQAIADAGLTIFLHPHHGVGNEHFGGYGHSLSLALGFPFETTVAVSRLILSGIFDRIPNLRILLAHSGGTLPFLAGRLDSCVAHDPAVAEKLQHPPTYYLKRLYYDAVIYHDTGLKATVDLVGADRIMFGTDNPFFPPLKGEKHVTRWMSVDKNIEAVKGVPGEEKVWNGIMGENAVRILNLK